MSVDETLGVTPQHKHRRHLRTDVRDSAALQDVTIAVESIDSKELRPSSKPYGRGKQRKVAKRIKGESTTSKPLPPAFKNETPLFWKTVDVFDSPAPDSEDWLWQEPAAAESKDEVHEIDTKESEGVGMTGWGREK